MTEELTFEIAKGYRDKARSLNEEGLQDTGVRRKLRIELQKRFGVTELEAVNILHGFNIKDYVAINKRRQEKLKQIEQERTEKEARAV